MRTAKSCGPDTPTLVSSWWKQFHRRRWQKSPVRRGEHEISRKTIVRGMPGETGVTVVTTLVCSTLFRIRDCGCIERPAFPVPFSGVRIQTTGKPRAKTCGENADACPASLRGALLSAEARLRAKADATKQSTSPL